MLEFIEFYNDGSVFTLPFLNLPWDMQDRFRRVTRTICINGTTDKVVAFSLSHSAFHRVMDVDKIDYDFFTLCLYPVTEEPIHPIPTLNITEAGAKRLQHSLARWIIYQNYELLGAYDISNSCTTSEASTIEACHDGYCLPYNVTQLSISSVGCAIELAKSDTVVYTLTQYNLERIFDGTVDEVLCLNNVHGHPSIKVPLTKGNREILQSIVIRCVIKQYLAIKSQAPSGTQFCIRKDGVYL